MNSKITQKLKTLFKNGQLRIGFYELDWSVRKLSSQKAKFRQSSLQQNNYKIHIGPGGGWKKPGEEWLTVDVDSTRADIVINFNSDFDKLPLKDESVLCIYGSHVFEHMSIYTCPKIFEECYRILAPGGYFRLVLPDARRSIELYLQNKSDFPLFQRRAARAKELYGLDYTLFECMKEDFLSRTGQVNLLGACSLAHQNAWDYETIVRDLCRVGFKEENINHLEFRKTMCPDFEFEGTYPSEANEDYRSLYVEAIK